MVLLTKMESCSVIQPLTATCGQIVGAMAENKWVLIDKHWYPANFSGKILRINGRKLMEFDTILTK